MKFLALLLMTSFLLAVSGKSKYLTDECNEASKTYKECKDEFRWMTKAALKSACTTAAKHYLKEEGKSSYEKCKCEKALVKCVGKSPLTHKSTLKDKDGKRSPVNDYKNEVSTAFCNGAYDRCLPKVDEVSLEAEVGGACGYDYDYDYCRFKKATCLTDKSPYGKRKSTNGRYWYQKLGKIYKVGDKCYKAKTRCLNCLNSPSRHSHHLEEVPCGITAACPVHPKPPKRCHAYGKMINDKCCERKNIAVERTADGITFACCEHGAEAGTGQHIRVCKQPYRKYKKIGEGWCRPSAAECPQGIEDKACRIPGIYADGEAQVKDGACEKWCNEEVAKGFDCIGYGIRRESSGRKKERCILFGPGMETGGSVRKAGKGLMKTLGQADGTEGVACYKRVIPQQDRETELAKMLNYLLGERLD